MGKKVQAIQAEWHSTHGGPEDQPLFAINEIPQPTIPGMWPRTEVPIPSAFSFGTGPHGRMFGFANSAVVDSGVNIPLERASPHHEFVLARNDPMQIPLDANAAARNLALANIGGGMLPGPAQAASQPTPTQQSTFGGTTAGNPGGPPNGDEDPDDSNGDDSHDPAGPRPFGGNRHSRARSHPPDGDDDSSDVERRSGNRSAGRFVRRPDGQMMREIINSMKKP